MSSVAEPADAEPVEAVRRLHGRPAVHVHEYRRADGSVYSKARYQIDDDRKEFAFWHRDASGAWKSDRGGPPALYRWLEVAEHLSAGSREPLDICSGESDADAVVAAGGRATCPDAGEASWPRDATDMLTGARYLRIIADDDEAGHAGARRRLMALRPVVDRIEVLLPAVGFKDVREQLEAGVGLEELRPFDELEPADLEALDGASRRFQGLTFSAARRAAIPPTTELVEGLIDAGTAGLIAGLPFARKTHAAQEIAHKVADGSGLVFGRFPVLIGGPVVYAWQDDSTAKELERIQRYADHHDYPDSLPLRFLLNEGVRLPDDVGALRALVERDRAVLLILDSLYNMLTTKLKDEDVALVLAQLKTEICDPTGCTVGVVDHAPWPTEGNRGQRRAYGSVFKTAAVRWAIHLEVDGKDGDRLHVEALGNNVAGFRRTPAYWDEDALEIRLLDPAPLDDTSLENDVLDWLGGNPGSHSTSAIRKAVGKRGTSVDATLERLKGRDEVRDHGRGGGTWSGRSGDARYWQATIHEENTPSQLPGTRSDEVAAGVSENGTPSAPSAPRRGDGVRRDEVRSDVDPDEVERLAALFAETQAPPEGNPA